ncbi:AraC family transcriptional regulator [Roseibacterium sp. SDUM158017]|uniref:AraC family transcriptional regulator n=1 Tax=Roseicyclus salinarum TaxID=3036773 RepID=UPI002414F5A6|nr:AraC family transcriptional regulator [Roseibacterium sp. SDUM158017]MDG4648927.1 AraC family transcriptional regulator [Roseibacterium sp. SDUM158017]
MTRSALLDHVTALLEREGPTQGALAHAPSGLHFLRFPAPTSKDATVYRPLLCLVLQGAKEVGTSTKTLRVADGQSLVVSHALPVVSRVTEATPDRPYVALVFPVDLDLLRAVAADVTPARAASRQDPFSISLCQTDLEMEGALLRYLRHCDHDEPRRLLAPITAREIHARLLLGPHAEPLRKLLWHETTASRIFQVTREIQSDLARPLVVAELAERAGMSSSAFFEHFKAVTGTSPLQYQKDLRLLRARDALRSTGQKVSRIAFGVGYESSAQFSREYARKFGFPPRQERAAHAAE